MQPSQSWDGMAGPHRPSSTRVAACALLALLACGSVVALWVHTHRLQPGTGGQRALPSTAGGGGGACPVVSDVGRINKYLETYPSIDGWLDRVDAVITIMILRRFLRRGLGWSTRTQGRPQAQRSGR